MRVDKQLLEWGNNIASTNAVADYWTKGNTLNRILQALENAGVELEGISIADLAPIDQFHARGLAGTIDLANRLPIAAGQNLLDIGCGVGGPARYMADRFDCHVSGLDITLGFITAGEELILSMSPGMLQTAPVFSRKHFG